MRIQSASLCRFALSGSHSLRSFLLIVCLGAGVALAQQKGFTVEQKPAEVLEKQAGIGERYALLIGISKYANPAINLSFAAADAEALNKVLLDPEVGGYKPDNIRLLVNDQASRKNVMSALRSWLGPRVTPNDSVIIFYSGHGALGNGNEAFWVTYDADVEDLSSSAMSNKEISQLIADLPAKRKLTLIDSCFSEATAKKYKALVAADVLNEFKGEGVVTMTASTGQEKSVEVGGHGAFTYHLLDALIGKADKNNNGVVEIDEVWDYLSEKVKKTAADAGNKQTPVLLADRLEHGYAVTVNPSLAAGATLAELKKMYGAGAITVDEIGEAERLFNQREGSPELRQFYRDLAAGVLTPAYFRRLRQGIGQAPPAAAPSTSAAATGAPAAGPTAEETDAFKTAQTLNTIEAWNRFLQQFPASALARDARTRLTDLETIETQRRAEQAAYDIAKAGDSEKGWDQYLSQFPNGLHASEARRRITEVRDAAEKAKMETTAYILAQSQNTEEGWQNFIKQFPSGQLAILAQNQLDAVRKVNSEKENALYQAALANNMPEDWDKYIKDFPRGRFVEEAMRKKTDAARRVEEENTLKSARTTDSVDGWKIYVDKYPSGTGSADARKRIDQLTWIAFADMKAVPAGSFMMGSAKGGGDEKPPHRVELDGFKIGRSEVTNAQYMKFIEETKRPKPADPDFTKNYMSAHPDLPVVHVSYNDAVAFCQWLSQKTGATVRLPSEAEWEYAALAGHDGNLYPWGAADPKTRARFSGNDPSGVKTVAREAFLPNDFGLYNLAGNVAEWVSDYYSEDTYKAPAKKNPTGPAAGKERVVRGGSFKDGEDKIRVAVRHKLEPQKAEETVGFRIVIK